jgi:hypothetical protein
MTVSATGISDTSAGFSPAGSTGLPKVVQDSLALSETMLGLVKKQIDSAASVTSEIVQSIPPVSTFSLYA